MTDMVLWMIAAAEVALMVAYVAWQIKRTR